MLFIKRGAFLLKMFGGSEFGEVKHTKSFPLNRNILLYLFVVIIGVSLSLFFSSYVTYFVKERNCLKKVLTNVRSIQFLV